MSSLVPSFISKLLVQTMRVNENSTVWIRPDQIEKIVQRNCPGDTSFAQIMMDDWNDDVVYPVKFLWHTKYTGKFFVKINGKEIYLFDNEVIRSEL